MKNYIRIFMKGGIISPGELKKLLVIAKMAGNNCIHFGSRQDILFAVDSQEMKIRHELLVQGFTYETKDGAYQNVMSSYISVGIYEGTSWVTSSTFLHVLDGLPVKSLLKIGVFDPKQKLVPILNNNINICASSIENYWYISLRFAENEHQLQYWPVLVYQNDISEIVSKIEEIYSNGIFLIDDIYEYINNNNTYANKKIVEPMYIPENLETDFEGIVLMPHSKKYRLGFYWRNNDYWIHFLESMADLCLRTYIGKICLSPWKSFMVKDVEILHRNLWEGMLGNFGVNMRHSGFELNWHIPIFDTKALRIKRELIKEIDKRDIRTEGLTFTIDHGSNLKFTSVVLRKKTRFSIANFDFFTTFDVFVAKDFNPNTLKYRLIESNVTQRFLPEIIKEISISFYAQQSMHYDSFTNFENFVLYKNTYEIWECSSCKTVYDSKYGDALKNIIPGTTFENVPEDYCCNVCAASKSDFVKKEITL